MVWSDKAGLLTWSCGRLVLICEQSSSYLGTRFHAGALVLYVGGCLHTGAGGCGCGRVHVAVVEGCGGGSGHGMWSSHHRCGRIVDVLWTLWTWLWLWLGVMLSSSSVDRPWVARGRVIIAVLSSSSVDGLWAFVVSRATKGRGRYSPYTREW